MKMKNLILTALTSACIATGVNAAADGMNIPAREGKHYVKCKDTVAALNVAMANRPIAIVRTVYAGKQAKDILNNLSTIADKPEAVVAQIRNVLAPVKEFFDTIHQFAFLVEPLVTESLVEDQYVTQKLNIKESLLLEFLQTKQAKLETFFEERVTTKAKLRDVCLEFSIFFSDLKKNFTKDTIDAYKKVVEELKKQPKPAA